MEERIQDLRARLEEFQESYGRRVYEILEEQENNVRNVGPDTKISDISKPVASTENIAEESCPICLEQFGGEHSGVVFLRCGHPACGDCIGHWVNTTAKKNNTCPLCRVELFKRRPTRVVRGFEARFERELLNIGESYGELQFKRECAQHLEEHIVNLLRELEPDRVGNALAR
ncbi:hypothetical protein M011DRAFT_472447 [Sporormia fimetaria CBS 119925]|uniref:RING-type domain-containing protein n=1 Tax=Sporormia fimetaria CBS 119925 TaxID=1340428 RepID=A0A6A6UVQ3_9PLEO|nr:hypothetical protein M011DRAFT_472447 [Sporormia fimetaria CBS 119925]